MDQQTTTPQGEQVAGIRSTNSLYCKTGRINGYRAAFKAGQGASRKDSTWDPETHMHTCCQSKVPWRHKAKCEELAKLNSNDFSDLKTVEEVEAPKIEPFDKFDEMPVESQNKNSITIHKKSDKKDGMGRCGRFSEHLSENNKDVTCKNCISLLGL